MVRRPRAAWLCSGRVVGGRRPALQEALKATGPPGAVGIAVYLALTEIGAATWLSVLIALAAALCAGAIIVDLGGIRTRLEGLLPPLPGRRRPYLEFSGTVVRRPVRGSSASIEDLVLELRNSGDVMATEVDMRIHVTDADQIDFNFRTDESHRFEIRAGQARELPTVWTMLSEQNHAFNVQARASGLYRFLAERNFDIDAWASFSDEGKIRNYETERLGLSFSLRDREARAAEPSGIAAIPGPLELVIQRDTSEPVRARGRST